MKNFDKRVKYLERRAAADETEPYLIKVWEDGFLDGVTPMTLEEVHKLSKKAFVIIIPGRERSLLARGGV